MTTDDCVQGRECPGQDLPTGLPGERRTRERVALPGGVLVGVGALDVSTAAPLPPAVIDLAERVDGDRMDPMWTCHHFRGFDRPPHRTAVGGRDRRRPQPVGEALDLVSTVGSERDVGRTGKPILVAQNRRPMAHEEHARLHGPSSRSPLAASRSSIQTMSPEGRTSCAGRSLVEDARRNT